MKEVDLPVKDLKTGAKVVGHFTSSIFEAVKPTLERHLTQTTVKKIAKSK